MTLLWSAVQWLSWLALHLVALSLQLAPLAASLTTVTAIVLVSAMTAQALEHGVLASMHRSKWHKASSYDDLRRDFYRGYWLLTLLYVAGSALWIYFTERTGARVVYGAVFCALWWGVQLALVVALTPLDEVLNKIKAAIKW
ncbi:hypothetical protein PHYSODRAFT_494226 [Phytophthora sojae]|uniref:Uncharacterized protein n=1 Tax=Phytophthora sojae (strain P6497) TaxID=1094619 RepID=G4Z9Q9_PHYSP|nr:hypothetical protein PHYSODRAFT_494226 [Phytophthora sojae]EGZ19173.1 hypothetical protein PHYSODRAFT_494226 [Phytophthora sojae]|eukprot:XP_009521890.1 hypothetical protein PHYSODRAFT_494226 [Phytophthora sojae]